MLDFDSEKLSRFFALIRMRAIFCPRLGMAKLHWIAWRPERPSRLQVWAYGAACTPFYPNKTFGFIQCFLRTNFLPVMSSMDWLPLAVQRLDTGHQMQLAFASISQDSHGVRLDWQAYTPACQLHLWQWHKNVTARWSNSICSKRQGHRTDSEPTHLI